jgi:hypothetical protein
VVTGSGGDGELASQGQHLQVVDVGLNNGAFGWPPMWQHRYFQGCASRSSWWAALADPTSRGRRRARRGVEGGP